MHCGARSCTSLAHLALPNTVILLCLRARARAGPSLAHLPGMHSCACCCTFAFALPTSRAQARRSSLAHLPGAHTLWCIPDISMPGGGPVGSCGVGLLSHSHTSQSHTGPAPPSLASHTHPHHRPATDQPPPPPYRLTCFDRGRGHPSALAEAPPLPNPHALLSTYASGYSLSRVYDSK